MAVAVRATALSAELQASRQRLVSAREEERRRLRRDLHDGLDPTLSGPTFTTDAARNLIAAGLANPQICDKLHLAAKTVGNHISSIFAKLQVADRAQAIVLARDAGLGR